MISLLRRPVLLLSAAATVTVPGALAVLALLGHDGQASRASEASFGAQAGIAPAASGKGSTGQAGSTGAGGAKMNIVQASPLAGAQATGTGQPLPDTRTGAKARILAQAAGQAKGMSLLKDAATAGTTTSYEGVEVIADEAVGGSTKVMANVWHRDGVTVTQTADAKTLADSQTYVSYDGDGGAPEGVFGVTATLVQLLARNYVAVYQGAGTVAGRPALIVEVYRANGSVAARFWLDERTMLPLRRYLFDSSARMVSDDEFVQVKFGSLPAAAVAQGSTRAGQPTWDAASSPVLLLRALNGQGCLIPRTLPGNLDLYAAAKTTTSSGQVVDLGFSDGLSVVSLFVEHGTLPAKMPGWQPAKVGGRLAYVNGHEITLSERGFVYTLVADAPPATVDAAVAALPSGTAPGVLGRIGRGLARLGDLIDPFN